jgi:hypothetical protein
MTGDLFIQNITNSGIHSQVFGGALYHSELSNILNRKLLVIDTKADVDGVIFILSYTNNFF